MFLLRDFHILFSQLSNSYVPNLYFIVLILFLIPLSFLVTIQLVQLILLESRYRQFSNYEDKYSLACDYLFIVKILVAKRLWFSSIQLLEHINHTNLKDSHLYFNIFGFIYYKIGEYNLAKEYYIKAVAIKNNYLLGLQNLAKVYEIEKSYDLALMTYTSILSYDPENVLAQASLIRLKSRDSRI